MLRHLYIYPAIQAILRGIGFIGRCTIAALKVFWFIIIIYLLLCILQMLAGIGSLLIKIISLLAIAC